MSESRDHHCPRCGAYLPMITVKRLVFGAADVFLGGEKVGTSEPIFKEVEDVADCVRCTGGY